MRHTQDSCGGRGGEDRETPARLARGLRRRGPAEWREGDAEVEGGGRRKGEEKKEEEEEEQEQEEEECIKHPMHCAVVHVARSVAFRLRERAPPRALGKKITTPLLLLSLAISS